jgi:hypothetical protein
MCYTLVNIFKLLQSFTSVFYLFIILCSGCTYDNVQTKYTQSECDLLNITWSVDIEPLVNQFCVGCHQGSSPAAGLLLDRYEVVKSSVLQGGFSIRINKPITDPLKMPPNATLDSCAIDKLNMWIANGAPEN